MTLRTAAQLLLIGIGVALAGCKVGPDYVKPQASAPPAYQEVSARFDAGRRLETGDPVRFRDWRLMVAALFRLGPQSA